jgi:hypothetical protein
MRWRTAVPIAVVAALGVTHFGYAFRIWLTMARFPNMTHGEWIHNLFLEAWPCMTLLVLSLATFTFVIARRRVAVLLLILFLIGSGGLFWYDMATDNYQVVVSIARQEYWESGGRAYFYANWWWY